MRHALYALAILSQPRYNWPELAIVTVLEVAPLPDPTFSMAWTTSRPSTTWPKTTCLPSSHLGGLAERRHGIRGRHVRGLDGTDEELRAVGAWAGVGHGEDTGASVAQVEVLVLELLAVDALTPGALLRVSGVDAVEPSWGEGTLPRVKSPPCSMN